MEKFMMNLVTSKRSSVLNHSKLKVHQLFLSLGVLDGKLSTEVPLKEKAERGAGTGAGTPTMKGKAGTETEVAMEESGAVAEAGVETVRRKGGGTGAETMAVTGVGSVAVSVAMIATDERYGMNFDTFVACPSFWFSETSVMLLESCGASHFVIILEQALLLTAVWLFISLLGRYICGFGSSSQNITGSPEVISGLHAV